MRHRDLKWADGLITVFYCETDIEYDDELAGDPWGVSCEICNQTTYYGTKAEAIKEAQWHYNEHGLGTRRSSRK